MKAKKVSTVNDHVFDSLKRLLSDSSNKEETAGKIPPAKIGDTVSNGAFSYSVTSVSFRKRITSDALHETADGIFLLVALIFVNHDAQLHRVDKSLVKLTDAKNAVYECSAAASAVLAMAGKKVICSGECKPGETISGTMIFDVPSKEREYILKVSNGAWKEKTRDIRLVKMDDSLRVQ